MWNIVCISNSLNFTETPIYMRNIAWNIQIAYGILKKTQKIIRRNHIYIYMRNIVWNIMCLPRASRNQAKTSSLGIALWNICGISKSVLLRAFEALGAFRSSFGRAILEAGCCSYCRSVSGRRGCGIAAV